jgi:hypothetical protein
VASCELREILSGVFLNAGWEECHDDDRTC